MEWIAILHLKKRELGLEAISMTGPLQISVSLMRVGKCILACLQNGPPGCPDKATLENPCGQLQRLLSAFDNAGFRKSYGQKTRTGNPQLYDEGI